jgi:hypothetical protein
MTMRYYIIRNDTNILAIHKTLDSANSCFSSIISKKSVYFLLLTQMDVDENGVNTCEIILNTYMLQPPIVEETRCCPF